MFNLQEHDDSYQHLLNVIFAIEPMRIWTVPVQHPSGYFEAFLGAHCYLRYLGQNHEKYIERWCRSSKFRLCDEFFKHIAGAIYLQRLPVVTVHATETDPGH